MLSLEEETMQMTQTTIGANVVLTPSDRIDYASVEPFREALLASVGSVSQPSGAVVVDMSQLEYISNAGLRALMVASRSAKANGVTLSIAAMQPIIEEIFSISRFNMVFSCYSSVREALAAMTPSVQS